MILWVIDAIKVVKNKVAPPFKQAEFDIMYGEGISKEGCILDIGADVGIINKSGAWYSYGDERLGQGRENAKQYLKENTDLSLKIEKEIKKKCGLIISTETEEVEEESDRKEKK